MDSQSSNDGDMMVDTAELKLFIFDREDGENRGRDWTDVVESMTLETSLRGQPGRLEFTAVQPGEQSNLLGACVQVYAGETGIFLGYIVSVSRSEDERANIIAYDQTWYLKNQDTFVLPRMTVAELVEKIGRAYGLKIGKLAKCNHVCAPIVHDCVSLWDMISNAMTETVRVAQQYLCLRDNFGELELVDMNEAGLSDVVIGEAEGLMNCPISKYHYSEDIEKNTYNRVKVKGAADKVAEEGWTEVDATDAVKRWGILQFHKKLTGTGSKADIEKMAQGILTAYCTPTWELTLECIGDIRLRAGDNVRVSMGVLEERFGHKELPRFFVKQCSHHFQNGVHNMNIALSWNGEDL